ncbi:MAG TPA: hypothetical protein VKW78_18820 [Terriglobales bacterium]|nr:hypothetical protein [Terriglobales bacterium]
MKRLRRVTEAEVIAEFLKNEFYQEEFHRDRHRYEHLVLDADLSSEEENQLRRALLFRRRGHMWRELPADTQWWEVELEPQDLTWIRVFPRAHWRKIANGSFALMDIVHQIRTRKFSGRIGEFISKIQSLSYRLRYDNDYSSVVLIGLDEDHPITIIEGNHRMTAGTLSSPETVHNRFRVFLGLSERMSQVCWYNGSVSNIFRYMKNRVRHLWSDPDANVTGLPSMQPAEASTYTAKAVSARKAVSEPK